MRVLLTEQIKVCAKWGYHHGISAIKTALIAAVASAALLSSAMAKASEQTKNTVHVFAASSLTNVVHALFDDFNRQQGIHLVPVFASSSSIARQVANGAPADIVILANQRWMDYLVDTQWVSRDGVTNFASNRLVTITSNANNQDFNTSFDLTNPKDWLQRLQDSRLAMGNPQSVPAGTYAKQALEYVGIWPHLKGATAPTSSVRMALTLVERQEVPLGIVYQTDALQSNKVEVVASIPANWHEPIQYPAALISSTVHAKAFFDYLTSEAAQRILQQQGFTTDAPSAAARSALNNE
ncbi:molybdate ABC transporter substrate-binding protein [Vibrio sp. SM6]|uniref:Molybdate ABC transporter substrate-binding protein n=1 Tax=Vibrio agarilyticus TaxID=2726741 RepID=A0A7X8TSB1_9VIBR|nr:molybdate ABC transporter substrate-binding protein [Vibrio agarilyticus]NLS13333.1 molybdate ABC transporter substrate-binding protein [Vibrio agarilyticus]